MMDYAKTLVFLAAALLCANAQDLLNAAVGGATEVGGELTKAATDNFAKVEFILYTAEKNSSYAIGSASDIISDPAFDASKPTAIFIHGFSESKDSPSVGTVSQAFLRKGSHNFIAINWGAYSSGPYVAVFIALPGVADAVGEAVDSIVQAGLSKDNLWIIGHSMGGQMAGIISRHLDFKPPRITALDPALPGYNVPGFPNLTRDDAVLVDVVHTDAGVFGYNTPCGLLDFWPNGGHALQPGCPIIELPSIVDGAFCSHRRSWAYFAESVNNEEAFPAVLCDSELAFNAGACPANATNVVYLGYKAAEKPLEGSYYLRTNDEAPFALGQSGLLSSSAAPSDETSAEDAESSNGFLSKTQDFFSNLFGK